MTHPCYQVNLRAVYAAAGTPNTVFPIAPHDLQRVTAGEVLDLAARESP